MKTVSVIGLSVAATDYAGAVEWIRQKALAGDRAYAVDAANTHVAALARQDPSFGEAMAKFDLITPDGMPLLWSVNSRLPAGECLANRVYGPTLMLETLRGTSGQPRFRHFLLGGKESTLAKLRQTFVTDYPGVEIAGMYSPPFGEWPDGEFDKICSQVRDSGANLVWVGLGCPKQERWIAAHLDRLPPGVYFGIGAAFAFHAGEVRQAPPAFQRLGMEWFYRLCMEPRRLFKRYLTYNTLFLYFSARDRLLRAPGNRRN